MIDEAERGKPVSMALEREGFRVLLSTTGVAALQRARVWRPTVVIVADRLPDGPGVDVLAELKRRDPDVHVFVTGRGDAPDLARSLVLGANEYIVDTFSPREVVARVMATTRRPVARPTSVPDLMAPDLVAPIDCSAITEDRRDDRTPRALDLLRHLVSHPRQTFSNEQLHRDLGCDDPADLVQALRAQIERDPQHPRWLVTIPGVGFRFEPGFADQPESGRLDVRSAT